MTRREASVTRYWFRPKSFGYGATPVTWQGWAVTVGGALLTAACFVFATLTRGGSAPFWAAGLALVAALTIVAKIKTDGAWRWRDGRDGPPNGKW